jgi:predicted HAD superfamily Cof-like phosphohydrolase
MNAVELHKRSLGMPDSWYENVMEFHRRFAPHVLASVPAVPPGGPEAHYGLGAIREELAELERAAAAGDVPGTADALGDLLYVTIRMGLIWGVDLRLIFAEIHASNLRKIGGGIREDSKVQKPPGWKPPDIEGVLRAQGWAGPPDPPVSSATRLMTWRVGDDTGLSSRCLARRLAPPAGIGVPIGGHGTDHPLDPADFGRCVRLLEAVPELRPHLPHAAGISPVWAALVGCWGELEALYREELPSGTARRLYRRMRELIDGAREVKS